ncbi:hypothetical protein ACP70R_015361 [Stipagrostis hirtigluma subsp. patula]
MDAHRAPELQNVWEDSTPPEKVQSSIVVDRRRFVFRSCKDWESLRLDLLNLGSGRFCIAKVFGVSAVKHLVFLESTTIITNSPCSPAWRCFAVTTGVSGW